MSRRNERFNSFKFNNINLIKQISCSFKGALSDMRQFLATESPLKMMKNVFYFTVKALFVLKIFWSRRKTPRLEG